jgi:hypothetical protein
MGQRLHIGMRVAIWAVVLGASAFLAVLGAMGVLVKAGVLG